jgi:pimeloyl-ACP methyl ester carboxylesterase
VSANPAADVSELAARLRTAPMRGLVYGMRGRKRPATLTAVGLGDLLFDSDYNPSVRAGVPAAVRAALDRHDPAPLLRLADAAAGLSSLPGPRTFSSARYGTVCEETPLPWPRGAPFEQREGLARAEAERLGPQAFFPFSYAEARADEIDLCLRWPEASPAPVAGGAYPAVPTLILQGGEDLRTPPASSERVAAALPAVQRIVVPGVGHAVTGGDPTRCGVRRLMTFLRGGRVAPCKRVPTLVPATAVPPVSLDAVAPAAGVPGVRGRAIAALDGTLDDLTFALSPALGSPLAGPGLRGGTFRLGRRGIALHGLRAVHGVRVSGLLPRRGSAVLRLTGARAVTGTVRISPRGRVRGRLGGRRVRARLKAGPPRPVASTAARREVGAQSSQFRHRTAFSSVRRRS